MTENKSIIMSAEEVAEELKISVKTLQNRKSANDETPPAKKLGRKVLYLRKDFLEWYENLPLAA